MHCTRFQWIFNDFYKKGKIYKADAVTADVLTTPLIVTFESILLEGVPNIFVQPTFA